MNGVADSRAAAEFFDRAAKSYDREFARSPLGQELRTIVRERLAASFKPGDRVLELNCGTGEDAVWLARRGVQILATDVSREMLNRTSEKAAACGLTSMIQVGRLDLARPGPEYIGRKFEGVFSNFGGLNCATDLEPLASMLAECVVPGGTLVLVFMGRYCAWEMAWHCLHFRPAVAFRRLKPGGTVAGAECAMRVWYPTTRSISRVLAPSFEMRRAAALGVFLPPTYLAEVILRRPRLFRVLRHLERTLAARFPFKFVGDHTICEYRRTGDGRVHER